MKQCADLIYQCVTKKYCNAEISSYGYSLGGYAASYLGKYEKVKELKLWSPVNFEAAVNGLTGYKWLGTLASYWGLGGQHFNSIENIKKSHENCKVSLFSGSCENGDFLSLEMSVLDGKKFKFKGEHPKKDFDVSKEAWDKIVESSNNNLKDRLTVSFVNKYGHSNHEFEHDIWDIESACY